MLAARNQLAQFQPGRFEGGFATQGGGQWGDRAASMMGIAPPLNIRIPGFVSPMAQGGGVSQRSPEAARQDQRRMMSQINRGTGTLGAVERALSGEVQSPLDPRSTAAYIDQAVASPLMRQYETRIKPQIEQSYGNFFGSRRADAEARALQDVQANISQELGRAQLANMQMQAQLAQQATQMGLSAIPVAQQMEMAPLMQGQAMLQAAKPFQSIAQSQADFER